MCTRRGFGLFIGYANIVCSIIAVIACIVMFVKHEEIATNMKVDKPLLFGIIVFLLIMCLVSIGLSWMLVSGIHKSRHGLMLPWIVVSIIGVIISFICNIIISIQGQQVAMGIISGLISLAIQCAIIYPIHTLYKDIRAQNMGNARIGRKI